jgi:hypothetical protein
MEEGHPQLGEMSSFMKMKLEDDVNDNSMVEDLRCVRESLSELESVLETVSECVEDFVLETVTEQVRLRRGCDERSPGVAGAGECPAAGGAGAVQGSCRPPAGKAAGGALGEGSPDP